MYLVLSTDDSSLLNEQDDYEVVRKVGRGIYNEAFEGNKRWAMHKSI